MSLETETVLDRRRLRRHLSLWRILAIAAVVIGIGVLMFGGERDLALGERKQIARIVVEGLITEDREQLKLLKRIAEAKHVAALIVFVNSPGGTTVGGEALFEALRRVAEKKPVVAQFGTVAASAAYIAGLGTDHIVARGNTITGSVGVIATWPEISQLLDKIGVKMHEVKSGPLKANPSPYQPMDEQGRRLVEQMVGEGQRWFLELVAQRRNIVTTAVPGLEQGRIFSGREARDLKLIDELGGEAEAVRWLEEARNVAKNLQVKDWKPQRSFDWPLSDALAGILARVLGGAVHEFTTGLARDRTVGALALDGLVSLWQPANN